MHVLSDNFTASLDVLNMKTLNDAMEIDSYILGVGDSKIQFKILKNKLRKKNKIKKLIFNNITRYDTSIHNRPRSN